MSFGMSFEDRALAIVADVTDVPAYFEFGTMFLKTDDSSIAAKVYNALSINHQSLGISFGKIGNGETSYDFV
jgi:hypothetical protein